MQFVDESSINFLQIIFPLKACKAVTYPMGWLRYLGVVQAYTVPAPSPNSGPVGFLLGSIEATGLIPASEEEVQVEINKGCLA